MTVQVKTPKEKQAVEIEQGATIRQVGICGDKKMTVFSSVTLLQWLHFTQIINPNSLSVQGGNFGQIFWGSG